MRQLIALAAALLLAPAALAGEQETKVMTERELVQDDGYKVSLSMPTEEDRSAWLQPGLRIDLGLEGGYLLGRAPSPKVWGPSLRVRARLRLDEWWSIAATLGYTIVRGPYEGLRWTGLVEPIFHPLPSLGVSLAIGYGGLMVTEPSPRPPPNLGQEISTRVFTSSEHLSGCTGGAWVGQARVEYLWVAGQLFSTGPYLLADSQWTACTMDLAKTDRETGANVVARQWWLNLGGALGWWLSWR
jgi:hypothetical protein